MQARTPDHPHLTCAEDVATEVGYALERCHEVDAALRHAEGVLADDAVNEARSGDRWRSARLRDSKRRHAAATTMAFGLFILFFRVSGAGSRRVDHI